jgi:hypothetical protein
LQVSQQDFPKPCRVTVALGGLARHRLALLSFHAEGTRGLADALDNPRAPDVLLDAFLLARRASGPRGEATGLQPV